MLLMKVSEALARALCAEADMAFGLMGDGNVPLWGAMVRAGMQMHSARHEAAAVAMADGYARVTARVGVATVTWGPGLTQIGTSLMVAARNRTPLVLLLPELPAGNKNDLQAMDQRRFVEACSTRYLRLTRPDALAEDIAEAFYAAQIQPGPVALALPVDLLEQELEWDFDYAPAAKHLPAPAGADPEAVEWLADQLIAARRPIIIGGRGAKLAGARDDIVRVADRVGALLATSLQAKGLFDGHAYDLGIAGAFASRPSEELLADADFVLGFGAELGYYTSEGGLLFPTASVARIDVQPPAQIGVLPGRFVRGDALKTAAALDAALERRGQRSDGYRNTQTRAVLARPVPLLKPPTDGLDPRALMRQLSAALQPGSRLTCGAGHFFGFVSMYLALPEGADIQYSTQFGAVGQTLPLALGMALARPAEPRILIEGDGSLLFHLQELETAVRCGLPMVLILLNDAGYGAEVHKLASQGLDPELARWQSPDYVALAKAFGGDGVLLQREADLPDALVRARQQGGLYLIDCRISRATLSDPYQKIHHGHENQAPLLRRPG